MRRWNSASSSEEYALSRDIMRTACFTCTACVLASPPTRCVGESGVTSAGWASSSARSSRIRRSKSASLTDGSSRT